jgi:hypothetical protein
VAAADAFLGTLSADQRKAVVFSFDDDEQRKRWSNLPSPMFERKGVKLAELSPKQREAALGLLAALLSPMGYAKTLAIMEGDEVLRERGSGPRVAFGRDEYYLSFLGQPSKTAPWTLQFGGHHLALNVTVHGAEGILTPSHTATQPGAFERSGKTVRPLAGEYDKAFALMGALDEKQKASAVIAAQMGDLVAGPGRDGRVIQPEGVEVKTFTPAQKALLLDLAFEWIGIIHPAAAAAKKAEVEQNLDRTWFAWSGPTAPGGAAYYRIQGPTLLIEFAPQRSQGDPLDHIHTIYRDPTNDYGRRAASR